MIKFLTEMMKLPVQVFGYGVDAATKTAQGLQEAARWGIDAMEGRGDPIRDGSPSDLLRHTGQQGAAALKFNTEYPGPNKDQLIEKLVQAIRAGIEEEYKRGNRPARRDAHPKEHGCVRANFVVRDGLPAEFGHGVFKDARSFPTWIRFSNSSTVIQDDAVPDIRGMALKLMSVEGRKLLPDEVNEKTQDFLVTNQPIAFMRYLSEYPQLLEMVLQGKSTLEASEIILGATYAELSTNAQPLVIASPLETTYFSLTPYLLGDRAVKYRVRPEIWQRSSVPAAPGPNFLRETLVKHLAAKEMRFHFDVQFQENPHLQPIENGAVEWTTPFTTLATVEIPRQRFDSPAQMEFGDNLSFTPWHSLPEHRLWETSIDRGAPYTRAFPSSDIPSTARRAASPRQTGFLLIRGADCPTASAGTNKIDLV